MAVIEHILNSLLSDITFLFQLNAQCLVSFADLNDIHAMALCDVEVLNDCQS